MLYEQGELNNSAVIKLFSELIKTGTIHHLQGCYHRTARDLIESEILTPTGEIN